MTSQSPTPWWVAMATLAALALPVWRGPVRGLFSILMHLLWRYLLYSQRDCGLLFSRLIHYYRKLLEYLSGISPPLPSPLLFSCLLIFGLLGILILPWTHLAPSRIMIFTPRSDWIVVPPSPPYLAYPRANAVPGVNSCGLLWETELPGVCTPITFGLRLTPISCARSVSPAVSEISENLSRFCVMKQFDQKEGEERS